MYQFGFHGVEVRFHDGIVQRITFAAHAARQASIGQRISKLVGRVLDALIGMKQTARFGTIAEYRHP